jgi:radical SAM superfamily enzyme YgiQ (UPF0313 family)
VRKAVVSVQQYNSGSNFIILSRSNTLFAGDILQEIKPVQLASADLLLIAALSSFESIHKNVVEFLDAQITKSLFPEITQAQVLERFDFLAKNSLKSPSNNEKSNNIEPFEIVPARLKKLDRVTLTKNFSLKPVRNCYQIWSVRDRKHYALSKEQAFILSLFYQMPKIEVIQKRIEAFVSAEDFQSLLANYIEHGFLIEENKKGNYSEPIKPKSLSTRENETLSSSKIKSWSELELEGRIPVYFVPHMENHYPLALGLLYTAIAAAHNGKLLDRYLLVPITYLTPQQFLEGPYNRFGAGIWLFSNYMWSSEINLQISVAVKNHDHKNITIHGGPSTPDYQQKSQEYFETNSSVDVCVHGEGEAAIVDILESIYNSNSELFYDESELKQVEGISFRSRQDPSQIIRTNSRTRLAKPEIIPSPYEQGVFERYQGKVEAAIIESNRGCPFGCTFCDWGSATNQKVRKYDLERVKKELDWIISRNVKVLWIADANYGMYDRDIELAQYIVDQKSKFGFPQEVVVNYTKNTTWRLAEIIKIFSKGGIISQGVISIQSTDEQTLKVINRKNIKTEKYDELTKIFAESNLPLSTDLMIGLPGSSVESFKADLQRYFERDISVKAYPTQLLPNSPMADPDYMAKYDIRVDKENYLISTSSYSEQDLLLMKHLYHLHTLIDGYSLLRYVCRYLQWEHEIQYTDFLIKLRAMLATEPQKYPHMFFAFQFFEADKSMPGCWQVFFEEVAIFSKLTFSIEIDSGFITALTVNELAMPEQGREYPYQVKLEHDFESYFRHNKSLDNPKKRKLNSYLPAAMTFDDPDGMASLASEHVQYDSHQFFWEIRSSIARAKSSSSAEHFKTAANA